MSSSTSPYDDDYLSPCDKAERHFESVMCEINLKRKCKKPTKKEKSTCP